MEVESIFCLREYTPKMAWTHEILAGLLRAKTPFYFSKLMQVDIYKDECQVNVDYYSNNTEN